MFVRIIAQKCNLIYATWIVKFRFLYYQAKVANLVCGYNFHNVVPEMRQIKCIIQSVLLTLHRLKG